MSVLVWGGFLLLILILVLLDLGVFHRKAERQSIREALSWSAVWVTLALGFNVLVYFLYEGRLGALSPAAAASTTGMTAALEFFTAYVLEKSLSVDNVFVIALIFSYFSIPLEYQHRLLFWGILGAIVLRGVMIALGAALLHEFEWIIYVFGTLLLFSAVKLMVSRDDKMDIEKNLLVRLLRRFYPISREAPGGAMFVRTAQGWAITPMLLALVLVETSDVMFAVDSIPAVFAVTRDPFLVFTSNIFALLGLRSLYFVLAGCLTEFRYLKMSLVFVLAYVGIKMLLSQHWAIPNLVSLAIIGGILLVGVLASVVETRREQTLAARMTKLPEGEV